MITASTITITPRHIEYTGNKLKIHISNKISNLLNNHKLESNTFKYHVSCTDGKISVIINL